MWKRLFGKKEEPAAPAPPALPATRRPRRTDTLAAADPGQQARLDQLRRRRELILFDVERAESAKAVDNPWQERIDLLDESLATVEADLAALGREPVEAGLPLPETPITAIAATADEPAVVAFAIGDERFRFEEETDWDQRGGPVVRGDLRQRAGAAEALVPGDVPRARRDDVLRHLTESVIVFATDLRDRALAGSPLPERPTLADLARPCPECGGWRDWRGTCERCAARAFRRQGLRAEGERLRKEREEEADERRKWAERLPIARRRLQDVEREIAAVGGGG